jgi:hypothetical protein
MRTIAIALALAFAVLAPAQAQTQPAALPIGLTTHDIRPAAIAAMRDLGVTQLRMTLYWNVWETDAGYRAWFPALLQEAHAGGMRVLVVVHGSDVRGEADRDASLRRFATFLADRVAEMPFVEAWQPWNEIDGEHLTRLFASPSMRERGQLYGRHLADITARAPQARLVAVGLHPTNAPEFWEGMLQHHRPHALAVHVYGPPLDERVREAAAPLTRAARGVPIWATEFGLEAALSSERQQRIAWESMERASRGVFARLYGYALTSDEAGAYGRRETHGILRPDGSRRPAATWLRAHQRRLPAR